MSPQRLVAAIALAAMPIMLFAWVELVSVEQPEKIQPGATFSAVVNAVGHDQPRPYPLEKDAAAVPTDGKTWIRLGVLVPEDWEVRSVTYRLDGGQKISLGASGPDEERQYETLQPAPPGYAWQAFGPVKDVVSEGTTVGFFAQITAAERTGVYRVGYMTWQGPWFTPVRGEGAQAQLPDGDTIEPSPSYLETQITVGDVGPAPEVTAFDPPDGAADVPVDTNIRITFDRDMDIQSLRQGGVQLYGGPIWFIDDRPGWKVDSTLDPDWMPPPWPPYPVPIMVFYNAETRTAVIDPNDPLLGETIYTVVVTREARATDGVPVEVPVSADFLTASGPWIPLFVDVPFDHIFREPIETLARLGIVSGFPDHTFRPYAPITRAQLATMLVRLLGAHTPEPDPRPVYTDIGAVSDETADFIGEATRAGIVEGFPDGTFRPADTVTRIQLVRMVVRAAQDWLSPPPPGYDAGFADVLPLDLSFVNWAHYNDLVDGKSPGRFDPWSEATRGHASRVLYGVWLTMPQPLPLERE